MQYYPPCVTPNGGQTYPCNPFPVTQPCCPCPQVIGEGNVASITLPDGSVQLYFVPTPAPAACCPPQTYPWNNPEAWFIRTIPNQFPAYQPVPNQQYQRTSPSWTQNHADYYGNKPTYQLKFHSDNWTSTTDLHYFSPPLRNWFPKQCASSQTDQPPCAPAHPPPWPDKPCSCACYKQNQNQNRKRHDDLSKSSCSSMSVEFEKEREPIVSSRIKKKTKAWPSRKIKISENPSIKCECDLKPEPQKSDKAIATYAEKTVGCCADNGRETQTTCGPSSTPIRRADSFFRVSNCETEMWYPKTPQSRKSMECTECAELQACESGDLTSAAGGSDSDATSRN